MSSPATMIGTQTSQFFSRKNRVFRVINHAWTTRLRLVSQTTPPTTQSTLVTAPPLNQQGITFYFVDGGTRTVTCGFDAGGTHYTVNAAFDVKRPNADWFTEIKGTIAMDSNWISPNGPMFGLHFGINTSQDNAGVKFTFTNATGLVGLSGFRFYCTQIGTNMITMNLINGQSFSNIGAGLDDAVEYKNFGIGNLFGIDSDSPGIAIGYAVTNMVSKEIQMTNYLMFLPKPPSIAVPIKTLIWRMKGVARSGGVWAIDNSLTSASIISTNSSTLSFPQWTNSIKPGISTFYPNWLP